MPASLRLFFALLMLLLAVPAVQANACAPATGGDHAAQEATAAHDMHQHHHSQAPGAPAPGEARHECVGCIPPIDIGVYRPVERLSFAFDRAAITPRARFSAGRSAPPEPPPPRMTV